MASSKPVIATITTMGNSCITKKIPPAANIFQAKVAKILSKVWPAIIFANNLTDNATTRNIYEISSIGTRRGDNASGAPGGKNKLKKCIPCFFKPIIFKPIKVAIPSPNVNIIWLVTVKVYGTIPNTLQKKIKKKRCKN